MQVVNVAASQRFVGSRQEPLQVLVVDVAHTPGRRIRVTVAGVRAAGAHPVVVDVATDGQARVEAPIRCDEPVGTVCPVRVEVHDLADDREPVTADGEFTVAEPGWTMFMVSHFHYDPVWWNTQAAYTCTWDTADEHGAPARTFDSRGQSGFSLVRAHLDLARRDPEYTFVLAEVDYLKPYWDAVPEDRAILRELLRQGRLEIMGGTYNEPNTNLTAAETTVRNALYGSGFQRDIMGADPATAWQLDAFGHDPQFPGLMADAGLSSSSWARGPFHQWGPTMRKWGDTYREPVGMQFPAEFSWIAPSGRALLTSYMVNHYMAGWKIDSAPTLGAAEEAAYSLFLQMRSVALTRNVLLPVGGDYSPPCRWVMDIHRDWNARYVWPRFVSGIPRDFFAAVRSDLADRGVRPSPQTRDMNPVYTGKDVSYIDTKQAQRRGETALVDAEAWSTLAGLLTGAGYPDAALDKAWRQLVYGAHHDAITGSESDQVYLDLLTGWREVVDLAEQVHHEATAAIAGVVEPSGPSGDPDLVVFNAATWTRHDVVTLDPAVGVPVDDEGQPLPAVNDDGRLAVVVPDVPGMGLRAIRLAAGTVDGWQPVDGTAVANEFFEVEVDPGRGGAVSRLHDRRTGRDLLRAGEVGNELIVQEEHPTHPFYGEGPWHLMPTGRTVARSARVRAQVRAERSPAGCRLTVTADLGVCRYTQRIYLWTGATRVELRTTIDGFAGADRLFRVRWPSPVIGGLPVSEVADAVVGRGFAFVDVDSERYPWTLDNPANTWFGHGSTARVAMSDGSSETVATRAIGVAEVIFPSWPDAAEPGTELVTALVRAGVTATSSIGDGSRYGSLEWDSNLPDVRIAVGTPQRNAAVGAAFAGAPWAGRELTEQLRRGGTGRVWIPPRRGLRAEWVPGADLRDLDRLPLLVVAGATAEDEAKAVRDLAADLDDATIEVGAWGPGPATDAGDAWDGSTIAVLNRGTPGFAVDTSGDLYLSLMRSCTGWPSGIWVDPPRRTVPDGSSFQLQRWTHTFDYAVAGGEGDWRALNLPRQGHEFNHPLTAVVRPRPPARASLPRRAELLRIEPADAVILDAVKPAKAPLARAESTSSDPRQGITVRLHEISGRPVQARVRGPVGWARADRSDLLETPRVALAVDSDGGVPVELGGFEVATITAEPVPTAVPSAASVLLAADAAREPAQPVFTRYWLHNSGPAPRGNLPVGVYLSPDRLTADPQASVTVRVSSELTDATATGTVRLCAPDGWRVEPSVVPVALRRGGYTITDVTVERPSDAAPGRYWLTAELDHAGQTFADVVALDVPGPPDGRTRPTLSAELAVERIRLQRGQRASVDVRLTNATRGSITGTLWALSSWGTWSGVTPGCQGFAVAGGAAINCPIEVDASAIPAGDYWLLAKIGWHGSVAYTAAVPLEILP